MREFAVYTLARLGLFVGSYAVVAGGWVLATDRLPVLPPLLLAAVLSALGSYSLLRRQRARFAAVVEQRARSASRRFEAARSKED